MRRIGPLALAVFLLPAAQRAEDFTLRMPAVKTALNIENQPIAVTVSGVISGGLGRQRGGSF